MKPNTVGPEIIIKKYCNRIAAVSTQVCFVPNDFAPTESRLAQDSFRPKGDSPQQKASSL